MKNEFAYTLLLPFCSCGPDARGCLYADNHLMSESNQFCPEPNFLAALPFPASKYSLRDVCAHLVTI